MEQERTVNFFFLNSSNIYRDRTFSNYPFLDDRMVGRFYMEITSMRLKISYS